MSKLRKINRILLFAIIFSVLLTFSAQVFKTAQVIPPEETTAPAKVSPPPSSAPPMRTPKPSMEPFSIIWIADTQTMVYRKYNKVLRSMGEWIIKQKQEQNVLYVVHTGDAVDNGFIAEQWERFDILYDQFRGKLPYFPVAGNHDMGVKAEDYAAYLKRPYVRDYPKERSFGGGKAIYDTFSAGGTDFILIGIGWKAELEAAPWVNKVLKEHRRYVAILVTHSYIKANGSFAEQGKEIHDLIVAKNPNIRLVLSGHVHGSGFRTEAFDDNNNERADRVVNAMVYNYQNFGWNSGQLRTLTFDPVERTIRVVTYSPYTEIFYKDGYFKTTEFVIDHAF